MTSNGLFEAIDKDAFDICFWGGMIHHKELVAKSIWVGFYQDWLFAEFPVHPADTELSCLYLISTARMRQLHMTFIHAAFHSSHGSFSPLNKRQADGAGEEATSITPKNLSNPLENKEPWRTNWEIEEALSLGKPTQPRVFQFLEHQMVRVGAGGLCSRCAETNLPAGPPLPLSPVHC